LASGGKRYFLIYDFSLHPVHHSLNGKHDEILSFKTDMIVIDIREPLVTFHDKSLPT
jgi:hypothetical protein